ncbi:MAG: sigma-54-dependent Fis family transcriptional regulator [Gemmatimonadetes bacterium]|nr:sigma-54-dependent Fis family transcriptional regulator [Gemmatimonadota bacterium]
MEATTRILGSSKEAESMRDFVRRAAAVDAPVLLTGESGTGKGLLARAIHDASARARRPFVAVNCAGVPETLFESHFFGHDRGAFTGAHASYRGLFEQADGGTLFLDEVAELTPALQAKLLTALEDGEIRRLGAERTVRVHARIIAAAGCDLLDAVRRRAFRRDLYHRLLVLSFHLPPLRDRTGDLDLLLDHFLAAHSRRYGLPPRRFDAAALERLRRYPWPGNVRELAHAVESAVLNSEGPRILLRDLPRAVREGVAAFPLEPLPDAPRDAAPTRPGRYSFYGSAGEERRRILRTLAECRGNKTRAAAALGMARNTLRAKLRLLGLEEADAAAAGSAAVQSSTATPMSAHSAMDIP